MEITAFAISTCANFTFCTENWKTLVIEIFEYLKATRPKVYYPVKIQFWSQGKKGGFYFILKTSENSEVAGNEITRSL